MCSLQFLDFLQPAHVALSTVERRAEKGADELAAELCADDLRSDADHVHVVVLDTLMCREGIVARRGADSNQLAGRDRRADPRAADEHAALGLACPNRLADLPRLVGIVDLRLRSVGAQIDGLVARADDLLEHTLAELDAAMVEGARDTHAPLRYTHGRG